MELEREENDVFQENATTVRTLRNIRNTLKTGLINKGIIQDDDKGKEVVEALLTIHGLSKKNFDFVSSMENIISGRLNDVSIDDNSNKNDKSIVGLFNEVMAPAHKAIGYDYLYRMMKKLYGKKEAKRLTGELYDFSLALSDSTKILNVYCYAFDASKIVTQGRPFGQLNSKPPKRFSSYINALDETIHQMASHLAGAIAISSFFLDAAHMLMFKEKFTLGQITDDAKVRKYIENCFQTFIYSVNHLSRSGIESPFTNVSIFDRVKIREFISPDNMGWYFDEAMISDEVKREVENLTSISSFDDYVVEYIMELERIFMDYFDKGDPLKNGAPYRFPVVTVNITKKKDEEGNYKILDQHFLDEMVKRDIYRYNIYTSEGTKTSMCCRLQLDTEDLKKVAGQVNSFGGSAMSMGSHRVVTTNFNRVAVEATSMDDFYQRLEQKVRDTAMILKAHKELILKTEADGLQPFISNGWISFRNLFSTFGITAVYEAGKTLKQKFLISPDYDVVKDFLVFFNKKVSEISNEIGIMANIEQIPAESMAHRLVHADKIMFGEDKIPYELYSNQFVPLFQDATLYERMEADGKYNSLLTGGGICHFNLGSKITSEQAKRIIEYAVKCGCEHFALNSVWAECEKGHMTFGKVDKCPVCGEKIVNYYTRIIGYFSPVKSWNKTRRELDFPNRHFTGVDE